MIKLKKRPDRIAKTALSNVAFKLDDTGQGTSSDRVWVQIAAEGEFNGYMSAEGQMSFTFDSRTFDLIANNLRQHPSFVKGEDGFGKADVIAWDFHHASEQSATDGTIPRTGAPAQGWVQDLAVRYNELGKSELWALTRWLEPAKTYIKEQRYKWASVSVVFDAVDGRSGAKIGPVLTSVALTNTPFIEGMQQLVADRWVAGMYLEPAETPEKALDSIRRMLGMAETTTAEEVMGELAKVKQWSISGTKPLGIDLDEIVGGLRCVLNLPALSSNEEVFAEVDKLVARLLGAQDVSVPGTTPTTTPTPEPPGAPSPMMEKANMDLLKIVAEKLGVVATESAITEAITQLVELRDVVATGLKLEKTAANKVILKASMDDSAVRAKYGSILSALGVENPDGAMDKIADLMQQSAKLTEMAPEFAALKIKAQETEEKEEEDDAEMAAATMGISKGSQGFEGLKIALAYQRKHDRKKFDALYREKIDLAKKAIANAPPASAGVLTTTVLATSTQPAAPNGNARPDKVDVSGFQGRNLIERTCAFVRASVQGANTWTWEQVHAHASAMVNGGKVTA